MSALVAFQTAIVTTGTAQNLPSNPVVKSVTLAVSSDSAGNVVVGNSPAVTADTGYIIEKGFSATVDLQGGNTNSIWIVGTSGSVVSVIGA